MNQTKFKTFSVDSILLRSALKFYVIMMSRTRFRVNLQSIVALMSRNFLNLCDSNQIWTNNHLVCKRTLNHLATLAKWLSCVVSTYLTVHLTVCYYATCMIRAFMSRSRFRVNLRSIVAWMSRNFLLEAGAISEV